MPTSSDVAGLADSPAGPELAAALGGVVFAEVPDDEIVDVLRAQARQVSHEQARLLAAMVEVSRTTPGGGRRRADVAYEWAAGEIAAALNLTARAADRELGLAETLVRELPLVFAALAAGRLDRARAWVFADHLGSGAHGLSAGQVQALCERLVAPSEGWTAGQLAARLLRAIIAIDPGHARRRYERATGERAVLGYLDQDGTVTITATGLPADEAAAACERLERLAAAAKRAGHPGRLAHIQADVFLGLLTGRYHHHTQDEIIADLLAHAAGEQPGTDDPAPPDPATPDRATVADRGRDGDGPTDRSPTGSEPASGPSPAGEPDPARPPESDPAPDPTNRAEVARAGVEIRVGLGTLLGYDEHPGEIPGLGPVIAPVARALVTTQHHGAGWRFAVTDEAGYLLLAGGLRRRPHLTGGGRCAGGVVEIHLRASLLESLGADPTRTGAWAGVVAEIAAAFACRDKLTKALEARPGARFARGALARHIQVRDRTCTHPGCRRPAAKSELDHTRDHMRGGPTVTTNIGPGCPQHHLFKSRLGWTLRQHRPGHSEWISPLGQVYRTRGEAIVPELPEPRAQQPSPAPDPSSPPEDEQQPILRLPPPETAPQPPPAAPPPPAQLDDEPPF